MSQNVMEADNSQLIEPSSPSQLEEVSIKHYNYWLTRGNYQGMLPRGLDVDYVRNILLKYLEYMASGENEKMALTLEKVLFTVLNASPQDLASLEKTRKNNNRGIWSYFYDLPNTQIAKPIQPRVRAYTSQENSFTSANNTSFGSSSMYRK